jgi:LPPG:FO 2-phospho-L-lactate transferase
MSENPRTVALCGGVGGAKLALGLAHLLPPESLTVVINTGDDFDHLGLRVCPDIDTVLYTLSGLNDEERGWGRRGETWNFLDSLAQLGGEIWFQLGDRDMALHVERTRRLAAGDSLTAITAAFAAALGATPRILPMSDQPVRTFVRTEGGPLAFQFYFVRDRCAPRVAGFRFDGAQDALPAPGTVEAIRDADLIVLCPSNPFVSIGPILAVPGLRAALEARTAPLVAVSPIVGGMAIKGPTAKMMDELGMPRSADAVARHYGALLDGFVLDETDAELAPSVEALGLPCLVAQTVMTDLGDKVDLARVVRDFGENLKVRGGSAQ